MQIHVLEGVDAVFAEIVGRESSERVRSVGFIILREKGFTRRALYAHRKTARPN